MSMFTLAISCLITSNLPWFMNLTFQVPMQYCSLQHQTLLPSPVTCTTGHCFYDIIISLSALVQQWEPNLGTPRPMFPGAQLNLPQMMAEPPNNVMRRVSLHTFIPRYYVAFRFIPNFDIGPWTRPSGLMLLRKERKWSVSWEASHCWFPEIRRL